MTVEEFEKLVKNHDLTFSYSDDIQVWRRGKAQLAEIRAAAKQFPPETVKKIWQEKVNSTLREGHRNGWEWRD